MVSHPLAATPRRDPAAGNPMGEDPVGRRRRLHRRDAASQSQVWSPMRPNSTRVRLVPAARCRRSGMRRVSEVRRFVKPSGALPWATSSSSVRTVGAWFCPDSSQPVTRWTGGTQAGSAAWSRQSRARTRLRMPQRTRTSETRLGPGCRACKVGNVLIAFGRGLRGQRGGCLPVWGGGLVAIRSLIRQRSF